MTPMASEMGSACCCAEAHRLPNYLVGGVNFRTKPVSGRRGPRATNWRRGTDGTGAGA